jgi:cellulose synthase/poly-beta-1,6-N-acetylglucosamine synthase-like glycosyltransferase
LIVFDIIFLVFACLLAVTVVVLAVEVGASLRVKPAPASADPARPKVAVVVPAHNEQTVLPATLARLRGQLDLGEGDRLVVVADNCTDGTADAARAGSAECVEREDATLRGKGHALDAGLRHLESVGEVPEVVIFNDADVAADDGSIAALARQVAATGRPAQGEYLMDLPRRAGESRSRPEELVSRFAFALKNRIRPLGLWVLGLPCPLTGSGMAFPYELIRRAPLASSDLVEDMRLGIQLCHEGHPPLFCPSARFVGELPDNAGDAARQRRRWEHGHLSVLLATPGLLLRGILRADLRLVAAALDHAVQPLTVLVSGLIGVAGASLISWLLRDGPVALAALIVAGTAILLLSAVLIVAWRVHLSHQIPASAVAGLPRYVVARVPNQLGFLLRREKKWVRTPRRQEKDTKRPVPRTEP